MDSAPPERSSAPRTAANRRGTRRTAALGGATAAAAALGGLLFAAPAGADPATPQVVSPQQVLVVKHVVKKVVKQVPAQDPETTPKDASGGFAPYVDTSLYPKFDLVQTAKDTGVKNFNLAFVLAGGNTCDPKFGGSTPLDQDQVAAEIGDLRSAGGDVRVSFGGANGTELGVACNSPSELADAYSKVIDQFKLTKVDFDIEGAALADTGANTRRAQAIASLQKSHPDLDVSFTLPVLPSGLTEDGTNLLKDAKANGVNVSAVNVMAMDYGDGQAPDPEGKMGDYAIDAATATQGQVKDALGLSDEDAWHKVAVTPMIGVNDTSTEVFTVADAKKVADFAASKHLAWLSMWSATRDKACPGGPKPSADATCSSIDQQPWDFSKAFNAYTG